MRYISAIPSLPNGLPWPRKLAIMGSTGSIGRKALEVAAACPQNFTITGLAAGKNIRLLAEQAEQWRPPRLAVRDDPDIEPLKALLPKGYSPEILSGPHGFAAMAGLPDTDMVLSAQAGAAGLRATLAAALAGKTIALANKESLVMAGQLIRQTCRATGAAVLPVDSEHYAIFQCLAGKNSEQVHSIVLTASGGPFRGKNREFLRTVSPRAALAHPNWRMGAKISIDSATMMNKGLEVIEACHLYDLPEKQVRVVIHPESLIHSLVEFKDASLLAQLAVPEMRLPIAACLFWPHMPDSGTIKMERLDLTRNGQCSFFTPDNDNFPCLEMARQAWRDNLTVELNAANEVAVDKFLAGAISFTDIPRLIRDMLNEAAVDRPGGEGYESEFPLEQKEAEACITNFDAAVASIEARDALTRNRASNWRV